MGKKAMNAIIKTFLRRKEKGREAGIRLRKEETKRHERSRIP